MHAKKRILMIVTATVACIALAAFAYIWIDGKIDAIWWTHPTTDDALTSRAVWQELHDELENRTDILDSEDVELFTDAARRWAIKVTIYGVDDTDDQDTVIEIVQNSIAKRPAYQAWIEFYLDRTEKEDSTGTIHYYSEILLREVDITAHDPGLRISPEN